MSVAGAPAADRIGHPYRAADDLSGFDCIVVGSGLGSLTTAAVLARRAGRRVLVLERHYTAGGYTHIFKRPGCEWDVGLHYVGQVDDPHSQLARLLNYVTRGAVAWAPMDPIYDRMIFADEAYDFVAGRDRFIAEQVRHFPRDTATIGRYVTLVDDCVRSAQGYFAEKVLPAPLAALAGPFLRRRFVKYAGRTAYDTLRGLTGDERLIGVLTGQWGDYGLPPRLSSFAPTAMIASHYFDGASYPVGGASRLASSIERVIEEHGGKLLIRAEVRSIVVERGRTVGVEMADGRRINAPVVISGVGTRQTLKSLLAPPDVARLGLAPVVQQIGPSTSMLALFVALDGSDAELGLGTTNLWVHRGYDHDANLAVYMSDRRQPFPFVYISFPSAKDPTFAARYPGTAAVQLIVPADYAWFRDWETTRWKHRGAEYDELKQDFTERLLACLYEHVPAARGRVKIAELGTPLSSRHFVNHPTGEAYGLAHSLARFAQRALRPQTAIRGLYLTGVDMSMCGIGGALASGYLTASAVLGRNAFSAATAP